MKVPYILFFLFSMFLQTPNPGTEKLVFDKFEPNLRNIMQNENFGRYFIHFNRAADFSRLDHSLSKNEKGTAVFQSLKRNADQAQAYVIDFLEKEGIQYHRFIIINAILVETDFNTAKQIATLPLVHRLIHDPMIQQDLGKEETNTVSARGAGEPEWGLINIYADQVWEMNVEGEGIVVGGADTGYDWTHSTIQNQYRGNQGDMVIHDYHWHDAIHSINPLNGDTTNDATLNPCGLDVPFPCDDNNHGTHTMGTIVGKDSMNQIGVAPKAKWIACRNMERGWGSPSSYIECFEWFLAPTDLQGENPDPTMAPDVINNSWRCPTVEGCNPDNYNLMREAILALRQAGIFVVVSAGNEGPGCGSVDTPPAIFDESFSVGAYQSDDSIASFSSRGPVFFDTTSMIKPDIAAPGVSVRSAIRNNGFARLSGTSMAGPHVAGAVALILSANPSLKGQVDVIEDMLIRHARGIRASQDCGNIGGLAIPNNTFGHGNLNVLGAVREALELAVKTVNPTPIEEIQLTPNPANQEIHWATSGKAATSFYLLTMDGKMIAKGSLSGNSEGTIDVSALSNGVYILRLQANDKLFVGKIVISR
jgi:subtilisin family serine protease